MKILLIEDHHPTAKAIQAALCAENIICDIADNGEDGIQICRTYDYDGIIVDLCLPDISGHVLLKKLRDLAIKAPVLILSGSQAIEDKVRALGFGADDYMTKPFDTMELIVRLKALSRRAEGHPSSIIRVGKIQINLDDKTVELAGQTLLLTGKEYQVFELMMLRKGSAVTKNGFLNRLYNGLEEPELKIVDVYICKIRKKMNAILYGSGEGYIHTSWGKGYSIQEPRISSASLSQLHSNVQPLPLERVQESGGAV